MWPPDRALPPRYGCSRSHSVMPPTIDFPISDTWLTFPEESGREMGFSHVGAFRSGYILEVVHATAKTFDPGCARRSRSHSDGRGASVRHHSFRPPVRESEPAGGE